MKELTVLMPVYNTNVAWLSEAIDSVLNQTYSNFDFLIIDDGSYVEDVWPCLQSYAQKDTRIKLIQNETNIGLVPTLNKGLRLIETPWIARMDADDICEPSRFEKQMSFLQRFPKTAVLGTNGSYIETGRPYSRRNIPTTHAEIAAYLPFSCCFIHSALVLNKEMVLKLGGYPNLERAEDYALWLKFLYETDFPLCNLPDYLMKIRKGNTVNLSYRKKNSESGVALRKLISNYLKLDPVPALWDENELNLREKIESAEAIKNAILKVTPYADKCVLGKELNKYILKVLKSAQHEDCSVILLRLVYQLKSTINRLNWPL